MSESDKQQRKQYDWLKGYQWQKGQSGNPKGRPKGKTLKEFAREYLLSLPDEEKVEFLATLPTDIVWQMAEGRPSQDVHAEGTINLNVINYGDNNSAQLPAEEIPAGIPEESASVQDPGLAQTLGEVEDSFK